MVTCSPVCLFGLLRKYIVAECYLLQMLICIVLTGPLLIIAF